MNKTQELEEALTLALRLSPAERLRLVEQVVASVERELVSPPSALASLSVIDAEQLRLRLEEPASEANSATSSFDYAGWMAQVEAIRQQIQADHGNVYPAIDTVSLLRDIRDGEDE